MYSCGDIFFEGRKIVRLSDGNGTEAWIDPDNGMNVVRLLHGGRDLVLYDPERRAAGRTYAVPVLYPTPNRVRDDTFSFRGSEYPARMHGLAYTRPFAVVDRRASDVLPSASASVTGLAEFRPHDAGFALFPWNSTLTVKIELAAGNLNWTYEVRNEDEKTLPYGFALHPFFIRHGRTRIRLSAAYVMEAGDDKLPTGALVPVAGTRYDLRSGSDAAPLDLDDVYFDDRQAIVSELIFPDLPFRLVLTASEEFNHAVVYTPSGKPFVCIENQTCSTDAHNMHEAGFIRESNLILVPPGGTKRGWINMRFSSEPE